MKFKSLLVAAFLLLAATARAQLSNEIQVTVTPPSPSPNEQVTISVKSFAYNLDNVLISWSENGKTVTSGVGKKSFSTSAPVAGAESTIVAAISLPGGRTEVRTVIRPSVMVLLWEATDSYVPPFYRGKALPTADSEIKVVAMPEVRSGSSYVPAGNMAYYWKRDYTNSGNDSGYGKNFFVYTNDYLDDTSNISVTASTIDQRSSVAASIDVGISSPKILFYKNDNVFGTLWNTVLPDTHKIQGQEVVEAIPYFISPQELQHPALIWNWFINDERVDMTATKKNLMPLVAEEGVSGTSRLRLNIENRQKIFQVVDKQVNIQF